MRNSYFVILVSVIWVASQSAHADLTPAQTNALVEAAVADIPNMPPHDANCRKAISKFFGSPKTLVIDGSWDATSSAGTYAPPNEGTQVSPPSGGGVYASPGSNPSAPRIVPQAAVPSILGYRVEWVNAGRVRVATLRCYLKSNGAVTDVAFYE